MQFYLQIIPYLPQPRKRSPDGASPDWGCGHIIAAYYSFIYPERKKGWVGVVGALLHSAWSESIIRSQCMRLPKRSKSNDHTPPYVWTWKYVATRDARQSVQGWYAVIKPPLQKWRLYATATSICLSYGSFVCLSPATSCCCCHACWPHGPRVSLTFSPPWKTSPRVIYASGGGLLMAPINAPHLFITFQDIT